MAKSSKNSPPAAVDDLSYEQAVEQLESIIARIEAGEVGLEASLVEYERGMALLKHCRAVLEKAEQRITELTPDDHAAATPPRRAGTSRTPAPTDGEDAPF